MKFAVLAYDFPHWKTQNGLFALHISGYVPQVVVCAPWMQLKVTRSRTRVIHRGLWLEMPKDICKALGFHYVSRPHSMTNYKGLDFGLILGARILPKEVIEQFKYGVINLHPGILPENRGLDNMQWAIKKKLPQGVTAHWIDEHVDAGWIIRRELVSVYKDDTLLDVQFRLQNKEIDMIAPVLEVIHERINFDKYERVPPGPTQKALTLEEEATLNDEFIEYKKRHAD